jgi:hypothetical protein
MPVYYTIPEDMLNVLAQHMQDNFPGSRREKYADIAREYSDALGAFGFSIVRTADLDLAERKAAHGCSDAPCGDCDQ